MHNIRKICLIALILIPIVSNAAGKHDLDAILNKLDSVIDAAPRYEEAKQARIGTLNNNLENTKNLQDRYNIYMQLYEEYRSYKNDTAIAILENCMKLAKSMNRRDLTDNCLSLIAFQSSTAGRYPEAKAILDRIDVSQLRGTGLFYYYRAMNHLYSEVAYYSHIQAVKDTCNVVAHKYEALILQTLDKRSTDYKQYLCQHLLFAENNPKAALKVCDEWLKMVPENSRDFAMVTYFEYLIRMTLHDYDNAVYWAARSAICDITHSVMDQASLWSLADYISGRDITRSYKYIRYSWKCASVFGTSVRAAQISPILSVIESEYKDKLDGANTRMKVVSTLIAILAIVLLFMLFYATKQRHKLAKARNDLRVRNEQLGKFNTRLEEGNKKLKEANERANAINAQLKESDQIKEAYIGRFLTLCSDYVDQMDKERKMGSRLIKAHKIEELYREINSTEKKEKDLEQLYGVFDRTFLNIFPTFVDDFNSLLKPANRIETETGKLNTTLRIFALIRLGIDDSGKIAEFLHYSVNTIYNYRARTKNGCIGNRDSFEDDVKKLGKI